jgi:tryptophanyl-tRNA synthetase
MQLEKMVTGIRPTGDLTIGNYLGAVKPLLDNAPEGTGLFVADLHALTDNEPEVAIKYRKEVVKDYLALGVDPKKFYIYLQSAIAYEVYACMNYLSRLVSVSELMRVPTLKDKLKDVNKPEAANAALLMYPVMMTADIVLQSASFVPVGEDQVAHLEEARVLVRAFNKRYGDVLIEPKPLAMKALRVLSLNGSGKMSKSNPAGAVFLTDSEEVVVSKIKKAETANPGEMSDALENLILIAKTIGNLESSLKVDEIIKEHLAGGQVMGKFKQLVTELTVNFTKNFQAKRAEYTDEVVEKILVEGKAIAKTNAVKVVSEMENGMKFV